MAKALGLKTEMAQARAGWYGRGEVDERRVCGQQMTQCKGRSDWLGFTGGLGEARGETRGMETGLQMVDVDERRVMSSDEW